MYEKLYDLSTIILRPSNSYGPRQGHLGVQGVIASYLFNALEKRPLEVWGDGNIVRDYIYIADLIEFIYRAGHSTLQGIYNAGSGVGHSVNSIIEIIQRVTGIPLNIQYREGREFDIRRTILDISKAKRDFGWSHQIGVSQGIELYWKWLIDNSPGKK
jgi:UDP-glucose 4-epimerase